MEERRRKAELSIQKKFRKEIWAPFVRGLKEYDMLQEGDRVAVCISGGKDSMLLAKCMQLLQRFTDRPFELVYLVMDPGYSPENRAQIEQNAALLGLPITVVENRLFEAAASAGKSPLLPVRPHAPRLSLPLRAGAGLQQDRARPPL